MDPTQPKRRAVTSLRPTQIDLRAILKQPTPRIDLKIPAIQASTGAFLKSLLDLKAESIARITNRRSRFELEKTKIEDRQRAVELETNQCKLQEIKLLQDLERESEERKEAEASVADLKRQLAAFRDRLQSVQEEIERYNASNAELRREKDKERDILIANAATLSPQCDICERRFSFRIRGVEAGRLMVCFWNIQQSDPTRECSVIIDLSGPLYKVPMSSPMLPNLPLYLDQLNGTRDIYTFIRAIRSAFVDVLNEKD
ncbi:hypothetical protein FISHEDRAFT_37862 [Fistulina hepatica ATCC 64428]|nr:hypothetical protein FISHEDRAFT_37862 [Fistulina hepatica ATCC 64428]